VPTPAPAPDPITPDLVEPEAVEVPGPEVVEPEVVELMTVEPVVDEPVADEPDAEDAATEPADDGEPTIVAETPTKKRGRGKAATEVATVPESRRAVAQAKKLAHEKSKAEKAALRASNRGQSDQHGIAEVVVAKLPRMKPSVAAILTGVIAGAICVALTWGEVAGCEAIRGHNNCNDGFGLLAIVVVLAIEIVVGASLLKAFRVSDPFSTSFLGVGLVAMVVMLTFVGNDKMASPVMIAVIPALTAAAFLLSWWVTVRFIEEPTDS
jgi:hypothetical protein